SSPPAIGVGDALDREVDRLGPAGCEEDLVRGLRVDQCTNTSPSVGECVADAKAVLVKRRRIAERLDEVGLHRFEDLGQDGCGGQMIEINLAHESAERMSDRHNSSQSTAPAGESAAREPK